MYVMSLTISWQPHHLSSVRTVGKPATLRGPKKKHPHPIPYPNDQDYDRGGGPFIRDLFLQCLGVTRVNDPRVSVRS